MAVPVKAFVLVRLPMDGVRQRGTSLIAGEDAKRAVDGKPSGLIVGMPSGGSALVE